MWPDLLIATDAGLLLFHGGSFSDVAGDGRPYYGITWNDEALFAACGAEIAIFTPGPRGTLRRQIAAYREGSGKLHQLWYRDGEILVVNTAAGAIDAWEIGRNRTRRFASGRGETTQHVNSVFVAPDGDAFVCDHNRGRAHVIRYDRSFAETAAFTGVGSCNHNVYVEDETLYTLDSTFGNVTTVDLASGATRATPLDASLLSDRRCTFGRGLARTPAGFVIGVSRLAADPAQRDRSAVLLCDEALACRAAVEIPVAAEIYDLRVVGSPDRAHNGVPFPFAHELVSTARRWSSAGSSTRARCP